jgi:hypothetical protein
VTRAELVTAANALARESRRGGAPRLRIDASRETVIDWLQWNDPNGSHRDDLAIREGADPYDLAGAWQALEQAVYDNL